MSRINLVLITLLILLLAACSQPIETGPGLGSPPPIACDVQALYTEVQAANDAAGSGRNIIQIVLQKDCIYTLAGRDLEVVQDSNIEIIGNGATIDAQGNSRVIINRGSLTLDGLTITGGHATSKGDDGSGGGIWNAGQLLLTNSTVSTNSADLRGGGVFNRGSLTLEGSSSNTARAAAHPGDPLTESGRAHRGGAIDPGPRFADDDTALRPPFRRVEAGDLPTLFPSVNLPRRRVGEQLKIPRLTVDM